jgi:hypothetical protein
MLIPLKPKKPKSKSVAPPSDAFASSKTLTAVISHEQISERAYAIHQSGGYANGHDQQDWFRAERELLTAREQIAHGE